MKDLRLFLLMVILLIIMLFVPRAHANPIRRIVDTDWVRQKVLRVGMVTSACTAQFLTGVCEGYGYGGHTGRYLATDRNIHAFETLRRTSWIVTGWMGYANQKSAHLTQWGKIRRFIGSALIARNFFEWGYKYQRYHNPFDSSPERNRHAMV